MTLSDEIKDRLDIVDVVSQYVPDLGKSGRNFTARCPFHQERTPSFVVFPERQTWRCFGACAIGGDVFTFVMKVENQDFPGALRLLAQRAGVALPERRREHVARHPLLAVNEEALRFFQSALASERGTLARDYLSKRGVDEESVDRFGLGYSPSSGDELVQHMQARGVPVEQLLSSGLAVPGAGGANRDMFRGRLTFAIRDAKGDVVGFAGRALDDSQPKYLNSPQTDLFDKGRLLYGLDLAKEGMAQEGVAVVVEGYMDVIAAYEHGYRNVVASMGTALTEHQVALLRQHARSFVLALDPDTAGQEATMRSLEGSWSLFRHQPVSGARGLYERADDILALRIAVLPDGQDPDVLIRREPEGWLRLTAEAVTVVDYLFDALVQRGELRTGSGKAQVAERLFPLIAAMHNSYDQDRYFQRLAEVLGVPTATLEASVGRPRPAAPAQRRRSQSAVAQATGSPFRQAEGDPLEEHVLSLLVQDPELLTRAAELPAKHLRRYENRALLSAIQEGGTMGLDTVKTQVPLGEHLERLEARVLPPADRSQRIRDFEACLRRLEERALRELKAQEEEVLAQVPQDGAIGEAQITSVNERLRELFAGGGK